MLAASYTFAAIGTSWSIETNTALSEEEKRHIDNLVESFDNVYSRFRSDSLVRNISDGTSGGKYNFPATIHSIWEFYEQLHLHTGGGINPLVGKSLENLGYDAMYSLRLKEYTPAPSLATVTLRDHSVYTKKPVLIDIGAIGKGLLVDIIADSVASSHQAYVVDASGDMRVATDVAETIGLEHPNDPSRVIGVLRVRSGAVCASATNRRAWGEGLHHVIDARTGAPVETTVQATWALTSSAMKADGFATGLFFASGQELIKEFGLFYYVVLHNDGRIEHNLVNEVGELFL